MKCLVTYKKNSWINEIARNLDEEFEDFHYIYASGGDLELVNKDERIRDRYTSMIRLGTYANYLPSAKFEYNPYQGIKDCSNKLKSRKLFSENYVPTPKTYSRREIERAIYENENIIYPIIGRLGSHYGGNEFYSFDDESQLIEGIESNRDLHYFSEFYPKSKEYRVHIASGKAIIVAEKVVNEENQEEYIWNLGDNGVCEDFNTLRWSQYRNIEEVIATASLACKALKLDYGAVDVIAYPRYREEELPPVAVLEVNSAPRLEEYGIERYTQYFKWLLLHQDKRAEYRLPHELDRFSFTNNDFEEEYEQLSSQGEGMSGRLEGVRSGRIEQQEPTFNVSDLELTIDYERLREE